jgi:dihydrofolate synthase/folylpolyglutamate synthase
VAASGFASLGEALEWLDGRVDLEAAMPDRRGVPTLDRIRALVELLGDPERAFPVIHVTGTNGKGSTVAMISALLAARGLNVGTFTSPNLVRVNERLSRNAEPIDDTALVDQLSSLALVEPLMHEPPTRFELLTAAALRWFADEAVDVAVMEVGLGGTWDATNVVHADVAVVTNISYDHTDVLGPTLEGIARDKAGIIKAGCRVVTAETEPSLVQIIRERADQVGASELWVWGEEFACTANRLAVGGRLVDLRTPGAAYGEVLVPLHGAHQGTNAACALAAVEAFFSAPLDPAVVEEGLAAVRVPGRLEVLGRRPLTVVDGAHNVAGMQALASALAEGFRVDGDAVAVIGMLQGRDPAAMMAALVAAGLAAIVPCSPATPRAMPAHVVAEAASGVGLTVWNPTTGPQASEPERSVADALLAARALVAEDGLLLVAGSLYVVGEALDVLREGVGC